jgi:hypothetical protein
MITRRTGDPRCEDPPGAVVYRFASTPSKRGGAVARDPDTIQRDIEQARDALAGTLDELAERANPKKLVQGGKETAKVKLADPKIKFSLIGVGVLVAALLLRKLLR